MLATEQPLFVFLHALETEAPPLAGHTPSAVAIDMDNRQQTVLASNEGVGERRSQSLHTAALFLGTWESTKLFHGKGFRDTVDTWQGVFEEVLGGLGGWGRAGFQLDNGTSFFLDNDVFPEDTLHATDPGFWTPDARTHRAGILHIRDAAIWTGNAAVGFAPSLCPKDYTGRIAPDPDTLDLLDRAATAAGIPWDPTRTLPGALDRILIGTIAQPRSAHAALAARQRITQDLALLPRIWRHLGAAPRPVVPVFL
jgi:hypothetical protein